LSFSQERLWFIDNLEGSVQYHLPAVLRLKGALDQKALENTLRTIINRHEVLRTVIRDYNGVGYQRVMSADGWILAIGEKITGGEAGLSSYISRAVATPFNLSEDYMLRAELVEIEDQDHLLVATMHH